ncbi:MAG: glycoside hydrolase family 13 protein, partial [Pseudonocardiaceae bacterium]
MSRRSTHSNLSTPHHDGSAYHVGDPNPRLGDRVSVFLRTPNPSDVDDAPSAVWVRTTPDAEPLYTPARVDRATDSELWWRADIDIRNAMTSYRFLLDGPAGVRWCTAAGTAPHDGPDATDFRLVADAAVPPWASSSVVYQIFPDRFARSSAAADRCLPDWALPVDWDDPVIGRGPITPLQVYGGDLDGVRERLDHIAALGANALYLTPIFPAESNHRYNGSSFTEVDPLLGGNEAYTRLAEEVHRRGWHLVGDLTTNHCGSGHPWFRAASASPDSAEREMFYFDDEVVNGYESWFHVPSLPKLNWGSTELRRQMLEGPDSVVQRWLRPPYQQDGWRIDVANMTGRRGADDYAAEVAAAIRGAMAQTGRELLLIGEHCHDASGDLSGTGWHGTMNYAGFTQPIWTWLRDPDVDIPLLGLPVPPPRLPGGAAMSIMRSFAAAMPWVSLTHSWNLLGSHDSARIRSVVRTPAHVEVAAGLMHTLPGIPMIFAGDEIGMTGTWGEDSRQPMPWDQRDNWDLDTLRRYREL